MMSKDDFLSVLQKILSQLILLHDPKLLSSLGQSLFDNSFKNTQEIITYEINKIQSLVVMEDLKELEPVVI